MNLLYKTLVSRLKGEKKFKEAALIASKYMNNFDESISLLCDGKLWIDAWRESVLLGRNDFIGNFFNQFVKKFTIFHFLKVF